MSEHRTWDGLAAAYLSAKNVEEAYVRQFCWFDDALPIGSERSAAIDAIPDEHNEEADRLQAIRFELEDDLLRRPSPHFAAFALKVLICRGDGRDLNDLDSMLAEEARQILVWAAFAGAARAAKQADGAGAD